jgi:glycosyltransferase involved in cell wall biosynthesis
LAISANFGFHYTGAVVVAEGEKLANIHGCDLILCHDYYTSFPALALGKKLGVRVCLDAHEYATGQLMHDRQWRNIQRPIIQLVQEQSFPQLDGLTTVSDGICHLLNKEYQLKRECITIRSIPDRRAYPYRDVEERVRVLYHGNVDYIRGLHKAIKSMPQWRQEFDFVIRGYATPEYRENLEILVESLNLTHRVQFADPVPFNELIEVASESDIGYFVHKDLSPQKRFVLPNKFFEYIQAGLALCVSDLPSMAEIVKQHSLGVLVGGYTEEAIATAINGLTKDKIREFKQASIEAREELCWEKESQKLISYYDSIRASR